jgi:hypothetical protein
MSKDRTSRNSSTVATGTGAFVHERVTTAPEPEHRPPPASRLPSWVTEACDMEGCVLATRHGGEHSSKAYWPEWLRRWFR